MTERDADFAQDPLKIVYQDDDIVAVNKPSGMLVHRSWLDKAETRFVMQTLRDQIGRHVFPLHRLDRPTSGVLIFGLSKDIAQQMMPKFAGRDIHKTYHAIVRGWITQGDVLDYPLKEERDKVADKHASRDPEYKEAITVYRPLAHVELPIPMGKFNTCRYTLVEMQPKTGRKHQLRRHMHHLSHHIVGDVNHGDGRHNRLFRDKFNAHQLMLHASSLAFIHPVTGKPLLIRAGVDKVWQHVFDQLGLMSWLTGEQCWIAGEEQSKK